MAVPAITPDWRAKAIQEGNDRHASAPFSGHQLGRTQPGVFAEKFLIPDADTTLGKNSGRELPGTGTDVRGRGDDRIYRSGIRQILR